MVPHVKLMKLRMAEKFTDFAGFSRIFSGRQQLLFQPKDIKKRENSISLISNISMGSFSLFFFFGTLYRGTLLGRGTYYRKQGSTSGREKIAEMRDIYVLISSRALNPNAPELGESSRWNRELRVTSTRHLVTN